MNTLKPARTLIRMLILLMIITTACSSGRPTRKQREVARIQNERQKEATKKYYDAVKRHHSIQDKETESASKRAREMHGVTPMRTGYIGPGTDKKNEDILLFGLSACRTSAVPSGYCTDVPAFRPPGIREYPD